MDRRLVAYWLSTGLFCLILGFSGAAHLSRLELVAEAMSHLGYPAYVMTILGVFKLLGVAALLAPRVALLKEWAYAGFAFNLLGATASHFSAGDPFGEAIRPAVVLAVGIASYLLRPASRRLTSALAKGPIPHE